jgi:hypothetical protein
MLFMRRVVVIESAGRTRRRRQWRIVCHSSWATSRIDRDSDTKVISKGQNGKSITSDGGKKNPAKDPT